MESQALGHPGATGSLRRTETRIWALRLDLVRVRGVGELLAGPTVIVLGLAAVAGRAERPSTEE